MAISKTKKVFPELADNPVRYFGEKVNCSVCKKEMCYDETNQMWITLDVGTDCLPLLANLCSEACEKRLPKPPPQCVQHPHKGGIAIKHPPTPKQTSRHTNNTDYIQKEPESKIDDIPKPKGTLLKLIRKIWEK